MQRFNSTNPSWFRAMHMQPYIRVRDPLRGWCRGRKEAVDSAQGDRVVVTRRGKPAAVLLGVEGKDWETVVCETSSRFWELIEERRGEPMLSAEELERKLAAD